MTELHGPSRRRWRGAHDGTVLEDITPPRLRCTSGGCPEVYKLNSEQLVIVDKKADLEVIEKLQSRVADGEYVIVMHRDFFENLSRK